jgi:hypothetical protein
MERSGSGIGLEYAEALIPDPLPPSGLQADAMSEPDGDRPCDPPE